MRCVEDRAAAPTCWMKGRSLPLFGPLSPALSHQEARLDDLSESSIFYSLRLLLPLQDALRLDDDIERAFLRQEEGGRQGWSQPPGRCWSGLQRVQMGRQPDRQTRCQGNEDSGLGSEEGTRAQTAPRLSDIPCPAGVRENTSSVSWGGKMAFLKNSFLQSIKKSQRKTSAKVPFSQIFGIGSGAGTAASGPSFPIAVARPGPLLGQLPGPAAPSREG